MYSSNSDGKVTNPFYLKEGGDGMANSPFFSMKIQAVVIAHTIPMMVPLEHSLRYPCQEPEYSYCKIDILLTGLAGSAGPAGGGVCGPGAESSTCRGTR